MSWDRQDRPRWSFAAPLLGLLDLMFLFVRSLLFVNFRHIYLHLAVSIPYQTNMWHHLLTSITPLGLCITQSPRRPAGSSTRRQSHSHWCKGRIPNIRSSSRMGWVRKAWGCWILPHPAADHRCPQHTPLTLHKGHQRSHPRKNPRKVKSAAGFSPDNFVQSLNCGCHLPLYY